MILEGVPPVAPNVKNSQVFFHRLYSHRVTQPFTMSPIYTWFLKLSPVFVSGSGK